MKRNKTIPRKKLLKVPQKQKKYFILTLKGQQKEKHEHTIYNKQKHKQKHKLWKQKHKMQHVQIQENKSFTAMKIVRGTSREEHEHTISNTNILSINKNPKNISCGNRNTNLNMNK